MSPTNETGLSFRLARPYDAAAIAALHADSWRHHYRGAYADAFLDGDVLADRMSAWTDRLAQPDPLRCTLLAEAGGLVGFANTFLDESPSWGALLDNLHVAAAHKRRGVGSRLMALTAEAVIASAAGSASLYLWVLEQNVGAQAFYRALGGEPAGRAAVPAPGGVAGRLCGSPMKLRYAWRRVDPLLQHAGRGHLTSER